MLVFEKEKNVNKYHHHNAFKVFSALIDRGAEVFTKKMFRHSQSKARERWGDTESVRQDKKLYTIHDPERKSLTSRHSELVLLGAKLQFDDI